MSNSLYLLTIFLSLHQKQNVFLSLFNGKIRKENKTIIFLLDRSKALLTFLEKKNKTNFNYNFFFGNRSLMYKEGFCKKKNYYLGPCDFLKIKTLPHVRCARAAEIANFLEINSYKFT